MYQIFLILFLFITPLLCIGQGQYHEGLLAAKDKHEKWGFKNRKGKWEINPQYDTVYHFFEYGKAIVGKKGLYGVIDSKNKIIIPFQYTEILPECQHLFPVRSAGKKWGLLHNTGKEVYPQVYDNFRLSYRSKHVLLQKEARWGIYAAPGKILIPHQYKQIIHLQQKFYQVLPFTLWEVVHKGKVLASVEADSLKVLNTEMLSYTLQGKKGIRSFHTELTKCLFEDLTYAHDSVYLAKKNEKWGIVSAKGNPLLSFIYESIEVFDTYFKARTAEGEWEIYRWNLTPLTRMTFRSVGNYSEGTWKVQHESGAWGYLNEKGELIVSCRYDKAEDFNRGLAKVTLQSSCFYINKEGVAVISAAECKEYENGVIYFDASGNKKRLFDTSTYPAYEKISEKFYKVKNRFHLYGILDVQGKLIVPFEYESIILSSDQQLFIAKKTKKFYLLSTNGSKISGPYTRFENMIDASEGFVKIKFKGAWGFCDLEGRIMISTQYDETGLFNDGICAVKLRGKWGYVNKDEQLVLQPYYDYPATFKGKAGIVREKNYYHLISSKGKLTIEYPLLNVEPTLEGFYIIQNKEGFYGLANAEGKEVFPAKYKSITPCGDGVFIVRDETYSGAIDSSGKIIVAIKYNLLHYDPVSQFFCGGIRQEWKKIKVN